MKKTIFGLLGVLLFGILSGYGVSWLLQKPTVTPKVTPVIVAEVQPTREIQLYFTAPTGDFLVPEAYIIPTCDEDIDCIRSLVGGLIAGSKQGNIAVLPPQTKVLEVVLENDLVQIDFSQQLIDFYPGGSLSELLSIYSIANSLNENFPYVRQLQITVEGEIVHTLKGHVRIDQPIYADFSYSQLPVSEQVVVADEIGPNLSIEQIIQANENNTDDVVEELQ